MLSAHFHFDDSGDVNDSYKVFVQYQSASLIACFILTFGLELELVA